MKIFDWIQRFRDLSSLHFVLIIILLNGKPSIGQPNYEMHLSNGQKINDYTIEFDILIKSTSSNFLLTSYQCVFTFNNQIANGGQLVFTYIEGTSQLNNLPSLGVGINFNDGAHKLTFASAAGSDQITNSVVLVGRFRLVNSVAFTNSTANINWCFQGGISTILTGNSFQNITIPQNHYSNLALSTDLNSADIPSEYQLQQNYPNPFNPSTQIRYSLKTESDVKLTVYNMLGELIKEMVNDKIAAGHHEVTFNSDGFPSGTYICRLEANNEFIGSRKMMLLK